jgi:hypothetical protein
LGGSLAPNIVLPTRTFVLPSSICGNKNKNYEDTHKPSQQAKSEDTVLQNNTETSSEKQENDEVLKQFQSVAL